jgi:8-oxo-dGTP pyrophosphatase MutT (NUDIX family)
MSKKQRVRPLAICLFSHQGRILVSEGVDSVKRQTFYRPLGGRIEFGELSAQTVARELMEEIGAHVRDLRCLGTLENLFTFEGEPGHEIVLVYDGALVDETLYARERIDGQEGHAAFAAYWKLLDFFRGADAPPLYPDGLLALIDRVNGS